MKRLIFSCQAVYTCTCTFVFPNTFETARYNMIIHVIVFLVHITHRTFVVHIYLEGYCIFDRGSLSVNISFLLICPFYVCYGTRINYVSVNSFLLCPR